MIHSLIMQSIRDSLFDTEFQYSLNSSSQFADSERFSDESEHGIVISALDLPLGSLVHVRVPGAKNVS